MNQSQPAEKSGLSPTHRQGVKKVDQKARQLNKIVVPDGYEQQFLEINEDLKKKLDSIGRQDDRKEQQGKKEAQGSKENRQQEGQIINKNVSNSIIGKKHVRTQSLSTKSPQPSSTKMQAVIQQSKSQKRLQAKQSESQIKKEYVHKMKEWQRQKEQLNHKKQVLESYKLKQKQQREQKLKKEKAEQEEFHKLQKKKQLEQKIQQIQYRRRQRQEALKNAVLKRSYNGVPKYLEYEQKFKAQQEEKVIIDMKLIKNKKQQKAIDPETLKAHQQAYIQRIKERLNMTPQKKAKSPRDEEKRQTSSDFNLYLKRSQQLKKVQLQKIIRRKKFQEKISRIPLRIDEEKKQEILISKDKAKNPQKYHILSQKSLNDQQIYQEFKGLQIELDPKKRGNEYLKELRQQANEENKPKRDHKSKQNRSFDHKVDKQSSFPKIGKSQPQIQPKQIISYSPEKKGRLKNEGPPILKGSSTIDQKINPQIRSQRGRTVKSRSLSQLSGTKSYEFSLQKAKERDSKYMSILRQKLAMLD